MGSHACWDERMRSHAYAQTRHMQCAHITYMEPILQSARSQSKTAPSAERRLTKDLYDEPCSLNHYTTCKQIYLHALYILAHETFANYFLVFLRAPNKTSCGFILYCIACAYTLAESFCNVTTKTVTSV